MSPPSRPPPVFSGRPLSRALTDAMERAAALAIKDGWLCPEHVLIEILKTETSDPRVAEVLRSLAVPADRLCRAIEHALHKPADAPPYVEVLLSPRMISMLKSAGKAVHAEGRAAVETADLLPLILLERIGQAGFYLADLLTGSAVPPPEPGSWQQEFLRRAEAMRRCRWTFPEAQAEAVFAALDSCGKLTGPPEAVWLVTWQFIVKRFPAAAAVRTIRAGGRIFVTASPADDATAVFNFGSASLLKRIAAALEAVPDMRPAQEPFFELCVNWQEDGHGSLNQNWFSGHVPAGTIRAWQESDAGECTAMYAGLEASGQVPAGFLQEFEAVLGREDIVKYVISVSGRIAGFSALRVFNSTEHGRWAQLSFGIVDPVHQRRGLGRTLMAVRLLAAYRAGCRRVQFTATPFSRPVWERMGAAFWQLDPTPDGKYLWCGGMNLTEDDAGFLTRWLGPYAAQAVPPPAVSGDPEEDQE